MDRAVITRRIPVRPPVITAVLCIAGALASYTQSTILLPVVGKLPEYLDTSRENASWVITAALLTGAIGLPTSGRLADLFGKRRVILGAIGFQVLGAIISATSDTLAPMIVGRSFQGLGLAIIPVGISLLRDSLPPERVPRAIATMSASLGLGGALGLPLAAWIADNFAWHGLFWLLAVLAAVTFVSVFVLVPETKVRSAGSFDPAGALGLAIILVCLMLVVSKGRTWGWTSSMTLGLAALGIVVAIGWARYELRSASPLVNLRLAAEPTVLATNTVSLLIGFSMLGILLVSPQLLQVPHIPGVLDHGMGQSILHAGLWVAPAGVMMLAMSPVSARLINSLGPRMTLVIGTLTLALGYVFVLMTMTEPWEIMVALMIAYAGVGTVYSAMVSLIVSSVPIGETAAATGLNTLMRTIGYAMASAVVAAVLAGSTVTVGTAQVPDESAFRLVYLVGAIAAVVALAMIGVIPRARRDPAPMLDDSSTPGGADLRP